MTDTDLTRLKAPEEAATRSWIDVAQAGFEAWKAKPHNARWFRKIDGTPIPNDLTICIGQAFADDRAVLLARIERGEGERLTDLYDIARLNMARDAAEQSLSSARAEGWKAGRDAAANWQPIATAPKDGPLILCSTPLRGGEHSCETWSPKALADELKRDAEGFYDKSPHLRSIPTHWMPLPANPATAILALEEPPHE